MNNKLKQFAQNKFSQFGEDGIIKRIFEILPQQQEYWCVEFGAWDGKHLSNTYELISACNWKGVLVEGSNKKFKDLEITYKGNNNAVLINRFIQFEGNDTLDKVLSETPIPVNFDLLSIDIDGNDYHIWHSLEKYAPKLVVIEYNPAIPADVEFVQEKDFNLNHGNSLLSITNLGKTKGYELIATTETNGFFVKKEFFHLFEIADNSVASMWDTAWQAPRVFQLYDGTLALTDEFDLLWSGKRVKKYDLQKLPKFERRFGDAAAANGLFERLIRKIFRTFSKE